MDVVGTNGSPTMVQLTADEAWEKIRRRGSNLFASREDVQEFYDRGDASFAGWTWRPATPEDVAEGTRPVLNPPADWAREDRGEDSVADVGSTESLMETGLGADGATSVRRESRLLDLAFAECVRRNLLPDDERSRHIFGIGYQMGFRQDGFHR